MTDIKKELAKTGMGDAEVKRIAENAERMAVRASKAKKNSESPPMPDSCMTRPVEEWSRVDRKGHWGDSVLFTPTKKYKEKFDNIDWSK